MFCTVITPLPPPHLAPSPLIQQGQLSVSGERMYKNTVLVVTAERTKPAQEKVCIGKLAALDMTRMG